MAKSISDIEKDSVKRGRPRTDALPIGLRLPPPLIAALDEWISRQKDAPSRPEAVRRLLAKVLRVQT